MSVQWTVCAGAGLGTESVAEGKFGTVLGEGNAGVAGVLDVDLAGVDFEDGGGRCRFVAGLAGGEDEEGEGEQGREARDCPRRSNRSQNPPTDSAVLKSSKDVPVTSVKEQADDRIAEGAILSVRF